jgi:hypothetical protein
MNNVGTVGTWSPKNKQKYILKCVPKEPINIKLNNVYRDRLAPQLWLLFGQVLRAE